MSGRARHRAPPSLTAAHHAVGVGVTGLGDGQALDDLGGHPGERPHHRHVGGVREELGRTEVTDLKSRQRGGG